MNSVQEEKSYRFSKLETFRKNPKISKIFVREIQGSPQKLSRLVEFLKILKKFFWKSSLSFDDFNMIFGILQVNKKCNTQKILDFRFSNFFDDFGAIFPQNSLKKSDHLLFHGHMSCGIWKINQNHRKNRKIGNLKIFGYYIFY